MQAPDRAPLALIHGFPLDARMWPTGLDRRLRREVLSLDLPGFGGTAAGSGPGSMRAYAEEVLARLSEAGHPRAILCGLSMGGYVLFEIWRRAPDRVAALVLCDTRAEADPPEGRAQRDAAIGLIRAGKRREFLEGFLGRLIAPGSRETPAIRETLRAMGAAVSDDGLVRGLEAIRDRVDSTPDLPAIQAPALVMVGALDEVTPPARAEAMHSAIPGSRLVVLPDAGHIPPLETPERFRAALASFLGTLES